jgi:hypothetical protein
MYMYDLRFRERRWMMEHWLGQAREEEEELARV